MLNNFFDYTRAPRSICTVPRAEVFERAVSAEAGGEVAKLIERCLAGDTNPPVDVSAIDRLIDVLRLERYVENKAQSNGGHGVKTAVREIYYALRPFFPVAFRKHLQRIALRGWDSRSFPSWPVDLSTDNLIGAIWRRLLEENGVRRLPFIWFWPDGHSSACMMTHDVETQAGRDFCSTMMKMERRWETVSAFEVVPEERYAVPDEFLDEIRNGGCEVCIHGLNHDGRLFTTREIFTARVEKINQYAEKWRALGFRSPVLYRNLDWFSDLKFRYDMSVPNLGHLDPQPGGCCTVMPYFIGNILELPLTTTQDYSLFNILQQRSLELWRQQIAAIQEKHGLVSFIIHPDYVNETWSSALYSHLLEHLAGLRSERGMWMALPRDLDQWWRARAKMELVPENGGWQIVGNHAERARVAYASLEQGKLVYSVESSS